MDFYVVASTEVHVFFQTKQSEDDHKLTVHFLSFNQKNASYVVTVIVVRSCFLVFYANIFSWVLVTRHFLLTKSLNWQADRLTIASTN